MVVTVELVVGGVAARGRNSALHAPRLEAEMAGEEEVENEAHQGFSDDNEMVYDCDGGMGEEKEEEEEEAREVTVGFSGNATRGSCLPPAMPHARLHEEHEGTARTPQQHHPRS